MNKFFAQFGAPDIVLFFKMVQVMFHSAPYLNLIKFIMLLVFKVKHQLWIPVQIYSYTWFIQKILKTLDFDVF